MAKLSKRCPKGSRRVKKNCRKIKSKSVKCPKGSRKIKNKCIKLKKTKTTKKCPKGSRKIKNKCVKKKSRSRTKKKTPCQIYLQQKIGINMREWKRGRYKSQRQALAVSYNQTKSKYPRCRSIRRN